MTKDGETGLKMTRTATPSSSTAAATADPSPSPATTGSSSTKKGSNGNGGNGGGSSSSTTKEPDSEIRHRPTTTASAAAQSNNKKQKQITGGGGPSGGGKNNVTNTNNEHSSQNGHQEEPVVNNGVPSRPQKPCCLCWCCCCSCSCLALRGNQENKEKHKDAESDLNCDAEALPSLEEIRSWGDSFEKLMRNSGGRKVFREFLKCEYSEENILFWLACEDLKKESKPELIEEKARLIYEDYISILSPKEVSLDSRVREVVNQNMVDPSPHTFDEAQVQIFTLMHRDSYPRFVNSLMYKKLAQLNTTQQQHRGSSVSSTVSNPASRKESLAT